MAPSPELLVLLMLAVFGVLAGAGVLVASRLYVRVPAGMVLLVRAPDRVLLSTTGRLVFPLAQTAELVDVTARRLVVGRDARTGYRCRDRVRAAVRAHFVVVPRASPEDVARCAAQVGAARVGDEGALRELFEGRFDQALAAVAAAVTFEELVAERERVAEQVRAIAGSDLEGWQLTSVAVVDIAQVPIADLDPDDLLDAEALVHLTRRTTEAAARVREARAEAKRHEVDAALAEREDEVRGE